MFLRGGEKRLQAVVIVLRDRVELVIVAAGAAHRQAEEGSADGVGHLGEDFVAAEGDELVAGVAAHRPQAMEPGRDQQLLIVRIDLVAGELFQDEAVERLVGVEGRMT